MRAVVSNLFRVLFFPHQGIIFLFIQLALFNSNSRISNISFIEKTPSGYENIGVGLLKDSSLMGTFRIPVFDIHPPFVTSIKMVSTTICETPESYDPWIVPSSDDCLCYGELMTLSPV
jgi:hypothetical protein